MRRTSQLTRTNYKPSWLKKSNRITPQKVSELGAKLGRSGIDLCRLVVRSMLFQQPLVKIINKEAAPKAFQMISQVMILILMIDWMPTRPKTSVFQAMPTGLSPEASAFLRCSRRGSSIFEEERRWQPVPPPQPFGARNFRRGRDDGW